MKCTRCGQNIPDGSAFCNSCGAPVGSGKPPKKKKTALIISIIALVLVAAIITGTIFIITTVSAKELQEAKDSYEPPAKAVTIDTTQKDPSNDEIQFQYDDRDRIITCTYSLKEKEYVQTYDYDDILRLVKIVISYKNHPIFTKEISYDQVEETDTFEEVDGYYVRLDEESKNGGATQARTITDAPEMISDKSLNEFLSAFVSRYSDGTTSTDNDDKDEYFEHFREYDFRHATDSTQNILNEILENKPCVTWSLYPGATSPSEPIPITTCPWYSASDRHFGDDAVTYNADLANRICTQIFHITNEDVETLYKRLYDDHFVWKYDADGAVYYCLEPVPGGGPGLDANVTDVKTDGVYYYVTYEISDYEGNNKGHYYFAVMEKVNLDDEEFWSMYINTTDVPDTITPFDPDAKAPAATEAATEASADYKQLYIDYLNNHDSACQSGKLFYINDDDIPEMILFYGAGAKSGTFEFCWIDNGAVQYETVNTGTWTYQERTGNMFWYVAGGMGYSGWSKSTFDGSSVTMSQSGSMSVSDSEIHYKIDDEEVDQATFEAAYKDCENWTRVYAADTWTDVDSLPDYIRNFG